ncbi:hypothetical protein PL75_10030 [Neisseria arctica]|uniref:Uncharacterized protein n=2 Tax=Neisseria arctica TaxID=1470200 RepID=A0A0J0YPM3_9NEIS|nr:hypothetical protein PL75_10030 [Neisseria arctica]
MFNHRLDVVKDSIGDNCNDFCTEDFIESFKYLAEEPYRNRHTKNRFRKHRIDGFHITTTTQAVDKRHDSYYDHNYGGRQVAEISADTLFFGQNIRMKMDVIIRYGYFDGINIDQQINIETDFSDYWCWDGYKDDDIGITVDAIIDEYSDYHIASKAKLALYRKGIANRLNALETALWSRYEELVSPYCEEYYVTARFSNGETWYEKAA